MSQYCYPPDLLEPSHVRLLRLLPYGKDKNTTIECQLFNYSLEGSVEEPRLYDALSYVWGIEASLLPISIDKQDFHIRANLYKALLRLRGCSIERIIWIDAVCINQNDETEKEGQIRLMAQIYAQASRVIVWLGEMADGSDQALEAIRVAGAEKRTSYSNTEAIPQAVLKLLQRPWFTRIWILQEVAAARHILIKCGPTEIDGYAFCLGVDSLMNSYKAPLGLQSLIRSVTYLIKGAIFRPSYATKRSSRVSLDICPLSELMDMYHAHKATELHDKVYALLGMSSEELSKDMLLFKYNDAWSDVLQRLIRFFLGKRVSIETWDRKQMAVIKSKGCVLGKVASTQNDIDSSRQGADVILKKTPGQLGNTEFWRTHWTLHTSAKPVQDGDVICFLQGASKPTIIRSCSDYFSIIMVAATPLENHMGSKDVEWPRLLELGKIFPRDFLLIWDWESSLERFQGSAKYETSTQPIALGLDDPRMPLEGRFDKAVRIWNVLPILEDSTVDTDVEEKRQEATREMALQEGKLHILESQHGHTSLSWAAGNGYDIAVTSLLANYDVDPDLKESQHGRTPLSWASEGGYDIIVKLLLETGKVNVDAKDKDGITPLWWAAKGGHEATFRLLLETGKVDVDAKDKDGTTPLWWAAKGGHEAIFRLLLNMGKVDVDAKHKDGSTPLWWAVKGGNEAIAKLLLQEKVDTNATNKSNGGQTILQAAAEKGYLTVIEQLLQKGAEVNAGADRYYGRTALQAAAEGGHIAIVELLLQEKADVNAAAVHYYGRTALQAAAWGGHIAVVELLLQAKADIDAAPSVNSGRTALQAAAGGGHLSVTERLLHEKADVNAAPAGWRGRTALQAAAEGGHILIFERLLHEKADVNAAPAEGDGRTALQAAAEGGHILIFERLLYEKADVHIGENKHRGLTALQAAAGGGHLAIVERLLQEKADVNATAGYSGSTALQRAAKGGHLAMVKRLLQEKADVNAPATYRGYTALQEAARGGHLAVVELLLQEKADVNATAPPQSHMGPTAIQYAREAGHVAIVECLQKAGAHA